MNYQNQNEFLNINNINLLWEQLMNIDIFKYVSQQPLSNNNNEFMKLVKNIFDSNIQSFYTNEITTNNNAELVTSNLNNKFLRIITQFIKDKHLQNVNCLQNTKDSLTINSENATRQHLQQTKLDQINEQYNKRQNEFDETMTIKQPNIPTFSNENENAISQNEIKYKMEKLINQRKYDTQDVNNNNNNNNNTNTNTNNKIHIDETITLNNQINNIIDLNNEPKKTISWSDQEPNNEQINVKLKYFEDEILKLHDKIDKLTLLIQN